MIHSVPEVHSVYMKLSIQLVHLLFKILSSQLVHSCSIKLSVSLVHSVRLILSLILISLPSWMLIYSRGAMKPAPASEEHFNLLHRPIRRSYEVSMSSSIQDIRLRWRSPEVRLIRYMMVVSQEQLHCPALSTHVQLTRRKLTRL